MKKIYFVLIVLSSLFLLIILIKPNTIESKKMDPFLAEISRYSTYQPEYYDEYYEAYQQQHSFIYALNSVHYPFFLQAKNSDQSAIRFPQLTLVNRTYGFTKTDVPNDLYPLQEIPHIERSNETMTLSFEPLSHYQLLYEDALKQDIHLLVFSAFRTYQKQAFLYENRSQMDDTFIAKPGHSEHQTGYAIDISTPEYGLTEHLIHSPVYQYLQSNAHRFGFILRYPKDKETITGYSFEPWHYRYVGETISKKIYEQQLTLEEYIYYNMEIPLS